MRTTPALKNLYEQIRARILMSGPMTVAEYMKVALTQPIVKNVNNSSQDSQKESPGGYYMKKDVFGTHGDFITSPEISQMFGEMVGVWGLQTWLRVGGPKKFNVVELGPGRGTLAKDIMRVFKKFERITGGEVALHLVEISPTLASIQEETLCEKRGKTYLDYLRYSSASASNEGMEPDKVPSDGNPFYHTSICKETSYPVYWYNDVKKLPREFHLYIAHEFFDALPIHKLQRTEDHLWREVLIDIDPSTATVIGGEPKKLRFIMSRNETPAIKVLRNTSPAIFQGSRKHLEISLESIEILSEMTKRIDHDGGIGLIVDYGHDGTKDDTFRGFYKHQLHDPLINPGEADLTADVDFSLIRKFCWETSWVCGPVNQREFLKSVGIEIRLQNLLESCTTEEEKKLLLSGYNMLMDDMGERFKMMSIFPKILEEYKPALKIDGF